ncbi:MAG: hypothetical protein KC503_01420 [Myxococcales bacterium]|nr:hypothetical protein [Myxococcales bacterium]
MRIELESSTGRPGPIRRLELRGSISWLAAEPAYLLGARGHAQIGDDVVSDDVRLHSQTWGHDSGARLQRDVRQSVTVVVSMPAGALAFIEEWRDGRQDVPLRLEIEYQAQKIANPNTVTWSTCQSYLAIPQSEWIKRLREMKWDELELIELPRLPLMHDEKLAQALARIDEARRALRAGDHSGTISKCRAAFESAAKYEVEGDGVKQGFDLLLERAFGDHQARRRAVEAVIAGLRTHANELGRHEQYPAVHVSRAEAEFAFASTVSVFSLISRCLAQRAAKGR